VGTEPTWTVATALLAALAVGCPSGGRDADPPAPVGSEPTRQRLEVGELSGLSGLAREADGTLYVVPERARELVSIAPDGAIRRRPIVGIPDGVDLESVAIVGPGQLAFGGERPRRTETELTIYLASLEDDSVVAGDTIPIDRAMFGIEARPNQGLEGLCSVDGELIAAIETAIEDDLERRAAIAVRGPDGGWRGYQMRLSSATGKVSALACRRAGDGVELFVVERHFSILRILRGRLDGGEVALSTSIRLDQFADQTELNLEGVEIDGDDLVFVNDNHYGRVQGENELLRLAGAAR
jgi:hypothetical protein